MVAITAVGLGMCLAGAIAIVALRRGLDKELERELAKWIAEFGGIER